MSAYHSECKRNNSRIHKYGSSFIAALTDDMHRSFMIQLAPLIDKHNLENWCRVGGIFSFIPPFVGTEEEKQAELDRIHHVFYDAAFLIKAIKDRAMNRLDNAELLERNKALEKELEELYADATKEQHDG